MKRRNFMQLISASAAIALLPKKANAEIPLVYEGPLFIFVNAYGGWDPTMLCDPKGHLAEDKDPMNQGFTVSEIKTSSSGSNIKYGPMGKNYKFQTFFDAYGKDLLIINGINMQTNGHGEGRRYIASGQSALGYPSLAALVGAIHLPSSPISYLGNEGYIDTQGIIPPTKLRESGIRGLSSPNGVNGPNTDKLLPDHILAKLETKWSQRIDLLKEDDSLGDIKASLEKFKIAHIGTNDLKRILPFIPSDMRTHPKSDLRIFTGGRLAIAGYKAGLTASLSIEEYGFDTHGDNDNRQEARFELLLEGVDELMKEAKAQGVADKMIIAIGSDFGRTPGYNRYNGKDHWGTSSMMIMGGGIQGNRVIGKSTPRHGPMKVNPQTLEVDEENGVYLEPSHIHKSLRKYLGISEHKYIKETFHLGFTEDMEIVI